MRCQIGFTYIFCEDNCASDASSSVTQIIISFSAEDRCGGGEPRNLAGIRSRVGDGV